MLLATLSLFSNSFISSPVSISVSFSDKCLSFLICDTNTFGGGDGSTIHEDSKFRGGTIAVAGASEYTIGQIVLALKNFGILEQ